MVTIGANMRRQGSEFAFLFLDSPAKAGVQGAGTHHLPWIPAFAGKSRRVRQESIGKSGHPVFI